MISGTYLLLYLEENYGLISEKKVQSAIKIVANENRYHPVSYTHLDVYKRQTHTAGSLPENIFHKPCTAGSKAPSYSACSDTVSYTHLRYTKLCRQIIQQL